ncbi:MAG: sulfite exporter TauE/SafE family protein [Verrucomicrobiota bacterium]
MPESVFFVVAVFLVALLYASVGHGGASGYLAVMSLFAVESLILRPTALSLNILVSALGTYAFFRAGFFRARLFWPLALASIPFAWLGGSLEIDEALFRKLLGVALLIALIRLLFPFSDEEESRSAPLWALIPAGILMGFVSGLIGVGGGIFLTPLVIFTRWAPAKTAAAISAPFIFLNSIAGLLGLQPAASELHPDMLLLILAVVLAGFAGSFWGSRIAPPKHIRAALAGVLGFAALKLFL